MQRFTLTLFPPAYRDNAGGVLVRMGQATAIPVVLIAFSVSPTLALYALGLYTVLRQVEGHVLTPNIMRSQTDVPQTLVLFALLAGGALGGLLGVLVSIPLAAATRVFVVEVVAPAVRRRVGAGPPLSS